MRSTGYRLMMLLLLGDQDASVAKMTCFAQYHVTEKCVGRHW